MFVNHKSLQYNIVYGSCNYILTIRDKYVESGKYKNIAVRSTIELSLFWTGIY